VIFILEREAYAGIAARGAARMDFRTDRRFMVNQSSAIKSLVCNAVETNHEGRKVFLKRVLPIWDPSVILVEVVFCRLVEKKFTGQLAI
jgi:hypothetical protein